MPCLTHAPPAASAQELILAAGVKVTAEDVDLVGRAIVRERGHSIEIKEPWLLHPEAGPDRVSFEDFCWGVTDPRFRCGPTACPAHVAAALWDGEEKEVGICTPWQRRQTESSAAQSNSS